MEHVWSPFEVTLVQEGVNSKIGDFYFFTVPCTASAKVVRVLAPYLAKTVELLPLYLNNDIIYIINTLIVLECLDESRSALVRFDDGNIMHIIDYKFRMDSVQNNLIFRISQQRLNRIYVSGAFKQIVDDNNFTGVNFVHVGNDNT